MTHAMLSRSLSKSGEGGKFRSWEVGKLGKLARWEVWELGSGRAPTGFKATQCKNEFMDGTGGKRSRLSEIQGDAMQK